MKVKVKLFGNLKIYDSQNREEFTVELPNKMSIADLLKWLNIPRNAVWTIFVNQIQVDDSYLLQDKDEIFILAPIGGG